MVHTAEGRSLMLEESALQNKEANVCSHLGCNVWGFYPIHIQYPCQKGAGARVDISGCDFKVFSVDTAALQRGS